MSRKKEALGDDGLAKPGLPAASEAELEEAQEQIVKLKSLLATKREQIATLRLVKGLYLCAGVCVMKTRSGNVHSIFFLQIFECKFIKKLQIYPQDRPEGQ
jgi:hypothetical protein